MKSSPLLTGYKTGTSLDWITYRLFFLIPLSQKQVDFLNKVIYKDSIFHINYWSLTHTLFGMIWGIMSMFHPMFNIFNYLIFHTLFEIWELYAIQNTLNLQEFVDIIMDTLFGLMGLLIITKFFHDNLMK